MDDWVYESLEEIAEDLQQPVGERDTRIIHTKVVMLLRAYRFNRAPKPDAMEQKLESWWRKLLP